MKPLRTLLLASLAWLLFWPLSSQAELVAIMSVKSDIAQLSREQLTHIYLGRYRTLENGQTAIPVDQPYESALRAEFYRKLVDKQLPEINAYWSRLIFSGKTRPPVTTTHGSQVLELVSTTPGAIGYINANQLDARVRVVLRLSD